MVQFYRRLHRPQVISFDLDDTLYDNVPVMQRAEAEMTLFLQQQYPQSKAWQAQDWQQLRLRMMQRDDALAANMTLLRLATIEQGLRQFGIASAMAKTGAEQAMQVFLDHRNQIQVPTEAQQLLASLRAHYHLIAISNGNVEVEKTALAGAFEHVFQPTEQHRGKPHADLFAAAMAVYPNLQARDFLHVGDHPYSDVLGAQRVGWQSAWFKGGLGRAEALHLLPTFSFQTLPQLAQTLTR